MDFESIAYAISPSGRAHGLLKSSLDEIAVGAPRKFPFVRPESRLLGCPLGTPRLTVGAPNLLVKGLLDAPDRRALE